MVNSVGPIQRAIQCVPALFPGVKRPGCVIDHPPPSNAEVKEIVELLLACMVRPRAKFTFVYLKHCVYSILGRIAPALESGRF
jgi:hypothetical protein